MKLDLNKIADELTPQQIIDLVTELGADRYEEKEEYIIFPTICHNIESNEANMKLYYYKKNHMFHCYTECMETFNIYELFKKRYSVLGQEYNFYSDIILKITDGTTPFELQTGDEVYKSIDGRYDKHEILVNIPEIPSHVLNSCVFYPTIEWLKDGISEEAMKTFNILYSPLQNKIVIPHYDEDNRLIGIRGRALNEEDLIYGKYMPFKIENKLYRHPLGYNLYGLNMNKDNIKKKKRAIVAEGEKAVLQYETMYGREQNIVVAVCGSALSPYQVDLLRAAGAEHLLIAFDAPNDMSSQGRINHYKTLYKLCERYHWKIHIGFIDDRKSILNAKESPTDKGRAAFEELIKDSVWIR